MARKQASKRRPISLREVILVVVLSLGLVWLVYLNFSIFRKEQVAQAAARDTQAQLTSISTREKALQASVNELSTARGQEAVLRETYGVALPGESVIIVEPPTTPTTTPPESFWQKWFGWLKFW